jgi:hypothetical protein
MVYWSIGLVCVDPFSTDMQGLLKCRDGGAFFILVVKPVMQTYCCTYFLTQWAKLPRFVALLIHPLRNICVLCKSGFGLQFTHTIFYGGASMPNALLHGDEGIGRQALFASSSSRLPNFPCYCLPFSRNLDVSPSESAGYMPVSHPFRAGLGGRARELPIVVEDLQLSCRWAQNSVLFPLLRLRHLDCFWRKW